MDAPVVAEADEHAVMAITKAGEVAHLERQFFDRETGHEHLHDRRILERFERVTATAGRERIQRRRARKQRFFHLRALGVVQCALIDQHRRNVTIEETLRERWLASVV